MSWDCISEILPEELYLSSIHVRDNEDLLRELQISIICDLSNIRNTPQYQGISYHNYPINDSETVNLRPIMEEVYQIFINKGNQRMLIHCIHGISRSPACVLYCLMKFKKQTLKESFLYVKSLRSVILPNSGFLNQLIDIERELHGDVTLELGIYDQLLWKKDEKKEISSDEDI